jgi:3-oxoadipate enol-lactonase
MDALVGGIRLHYEVTGDAGSTVVLTHGLGGRVEVWDPHVEALARHHRVVRWDLRGHGRSAIPAGPYTPPDFARDLAGLLDHLGTARAHLVGHSGGGVVSQRFALDFPDRVASLVLVSTSSEVGERARAGWTKIADTIEREGFGPEREPDTRSFGSAFAAAHPEVVRTLARQTRENDPAAYAAAARAFGTYGWTAELARIEAPALVLQGLDDRLTPPGGSVILARNLRRSRLLMIDGAGHNLPIEMPLLFVATVTAFLAGIDLAATPAPH